MERAQLRFEYVDRMLNVPAIASPFERLKFLEHLITEIKRFERWCIARIKSMLSNEHFEIVCIACHSPDNHDYSPFPLLYMHQIHPVRIPLATFLKRKTFA